MKRLLRRTTGLDRAIILLLLAGSLAGIWLAAARPQGERVVVWQEGQIVFQAPLGQDRTARLGGPLGESLLQIRGGTVRLIDSPCPHRVCVGMGGVSRVGDLLACVPNRLLVRIEGGGIEEKTYDLLTR